MSTYISKFEQGMMVIKKGKQIDASISIGDKVKLKGEYYVSSKGAKFFKEGVENNPDFWTKK